MASGEPVVRLTGISACRTTAACAGTADESVTTIGYGPQTAGVGNTLLPVSATVAAGDGSVGSTTLAGYDDIGNLTSIDGPLPGTADTTTFRYDAARRRVGAVGADPDGAGPRVRLAQRYDHDGRDRITAAATGTVRDGSDAAWDAFAPATLVYDDYDAAGRLARRTRQSGGVRTAVQDYLYDATGQLTCAIAHMDLAQSSPPATLCAPSQTAGPDGPDRVTKTGYDALGRAVLVQTALGTADQADDAASTYTAGGALATLTDANGNVTGYTYDGFDRVLETHFPQASGGQPSASDYERLGYDAGGNVTSRRLRDGQMLYYGYDALGRRVADDLPDTNVAERDVAYAYDNLGALVRAQDTNGWYSAYGYDALGRVTAESSNVFGNAYAYDAGGRLTRQQWQDGFFVDYDYDVTGNMTAVRENGATSGAGVLATYAYDDLGRRTGLVRGNGTTTSYGYDAASRLGSLGHDMGGTAYDVTYGFSYNAGGQIASTTRSNDVYAHAHTDRDEASTINGLNQATSVGGATLAYDARGNLTNPGGTQYTFDTRNQLYTDGTHLLYRGPDGLVGQEIWGPEQHAFDHARGQLSTEFGYGNGGQFRRFVYGAGVDEPLVWYEGQGTTDRRWLHADERGSVVAVSDASGVVTAVNTYDEHGVPGAGNVGRLQYTGQMWLPALGLYDYKARMYAPELGRFLQTDPIGYGDGMNWYGYVGGDPVNRSDPSGTFTACTGSLLADYEKGECGNVGNLWINGTNTQVAEMEARNAVLSAVNRLINALKQPPGNGVGALPRTTDRKTSDPVNFLPLNAADRGVLNKILSDKDVRRDFSNAWTSTLITGNEHSFTIFGNSNKTDYVTGFPMNGSRSQTDIYAGSGTIQIRGNLFFAAAQFHTHPGNYPEAFYPSYQDVTGGNPLGLIVLIGTRLQVGSDKGIIRYGR